ncbi:hypothetical protein LCGC14_0278120 [marine sediment metagenome]|uniref:Uncharacterized protein n=1 Tax=marine sediment metagenome TaxID=412755 RepID=A0A0F9U1R0_9ZZZZ
MRELDQPLEYSGEVFRYREQLVGFGDGGTYKDINEEEIQDFINEYTYDRPLKSWPGPWRWILLLGVATVLFIILYFSNYGT